MGAGSVALTHIAMAPSHAYSPLNVMCAAGTVLSDGSSLL